MNRHYSLVSIRANHRCEYCHAPESVFNFHFEVEHIFPVSLGGSEAETNLALACQSCNVFKSDCVSSFDEITQSEIPLFNPRIGIWEEHFTVNIETGEIRGVTPIGRLTVIQLRINSPSQIRARMQWIRLEVFP